MVANSSSDGVVLQTDEAHILPDAADCHTGEVELEVYCGLHTGWFAAAAAEVVTVVLHTVLLDAAVADALWAQLRAAEAWA